jgi:hypothetical protein
MSLKLRGKNQILSSFESIMDDDSIVNDEFFYKFLTLKGK